MIFGLDEFTNIHMRFRMHKLNSCIINGDLVRPHIFSIFTKKKKKKKGLMPLLIFDVFVTIELKN